MLLLRRIRRIRLQFLQILAAARQLAAAVMNQTDDVSRLLTDEKSLCHNISSFKIKNPVYIVTYLIFYGYIFLAFTIPCIQAVLVRRCSRR